MPWADTLLDVSGFLKASDIDSIAELQAIITDATLVLTSMKGQPGGVASLNMAAKLNSTEIPTIPTANIQGITGVGTSLLQAVNAAAGRTTLALGDAATRNVGAGAGDVAAGDEPVAAGHASASGAGVHGAGVTGADVLAAADQATAQTAVGTDAAGAARPPDAHAIGAHTGAGDIVTRDAAEFATSAQGDKADLAYVSTLRITIVNDQSSTDTLSTVIGTLLIDRTKYAYTTVKFRAEGAISGAATGELDLYDLTAGSLVTTLALNNGTFGVETTVTIPAVPAGAHLLEGIVRRVGGAAEDKIYVGWGGLVLA